MDIKSKYRLQAYIDGQYTYRSVGRRLMAARLQRLVIYTAAIRACAHV